MSLTNLPNLLIVDDNKENLAFLRTVMKKIKVNLIQAQSGSEALVKTQGIELALAIVDVQMPEMDGYQLAILINKERGGAKVPIIFLTAQHFSDMEVLTGYDSGAVDYIFKPVTKQVLLSKVNVFLDLFIQKQTIILNIAGRIQAEEKLKQLNGELEDRVHRRTIELEKSNAAIQQIHSNHKTFFNSIDDFLIVLDEQGNIIHTNTTVINRLGYTSEELIGKSVLMFHPPERHDETAKILENILSGIEDSCNIPFYTKSGMQIPVETWVKKSIWDDKPVFFVVTKDISRIKLSEEKFSKVFHVNPSACGLSNLEDHKYVEVNEAFYTLLGFDKTEVIGNTVWDLGIMTFEARNAILQKADNKGRIKNIETDLKAKSGEIKHVMLSSENINLHDKNYRFTVVHDITKRKRAEKALKKSEAMLSKAQQVAHIGSWELDERTQELNWSDETFRMFGYDPCVVKPSLDLFMRCIHPESISEVLECIAETRNSQTPYSVDHRIILPDGLVRFVHEQAEVIYDNAGRSVKWFGTVQDITERKMVENELKNAIEQLRQLTQHREKIRENERVAISRELHDDLGQALTAVKIDLGIIRHAVADYKVVLKINKVSDLVSETIKTVQRLTSELRPQVLDDLGLEAAIEWYTKEFMERNKVDLLIHMDSGLTITPDASLIIFRIMQESLTNIARHAKATHVDIGLSTADDCINLRISDNGIGISEKEINSTKSFGIISMKERAESLGGTLNIYRENDFETVVQLFLPLNKGTYENSDL